MRLEVSHMVTCRVVLLSCLIKEGLDLDLSIWGGGGGYCDISKCLMTRAARRVKLSWNWR